MTNRKLEEALEEMWQLVKVLKGKLFEGTEMEEKGYFRQNGEHMWRKLSVGRY